MVLILCYCIPILVFFILLYIKKYRFEKNDLIHLLFCGVLSLLFSLTSFLFPLEEPKSIGLELLIYEVLIAGLCEELAKYISIKLTKPKSSTEFFVNGMIVSLCFMLLENIMYHTGTFRMFFPGHLLFQLIMVAFLIMAQKQNAKLKKIILNFLSLIVPIILHGMYDTYNSTISIKTKLFLGVILYLGIIIITLLIVKPRESLEEKRKLTKKSILKILFIVLWTMLSMINIFNDNIKYEMNHDVKIREDNLIINVKDYSVVDINNESYTKIKINVKNTGKKEKSLSFFLYNDGKMVMESGYYDDKLPYIIKANEVVTGYLYYEGDFNNNNNLFLMYKANKSSIKYYFELK